MTAFKLHHTKFYTRHTGETNGNPHCYRCDEILANDNRVWLHDHGFNSFSLTGVDAALDDAEHGGNPIVVMGAFCALKAIAGF